MEPLLRRNPAQFDLFSAEYADILWMSKRARGALYVTEEFNFSGDIEQWKALKPEERDFTSQVLACCAKVNRTVSKNWVSLFYDKHKESELNWIYNYQMVKIEIHAQLYRTIINNYITILEDRDTFFNTFEILPCFKKKADWALMWKMNESATFGERIVACAVAEGIFCAGNFASIFWLRKQGLIPTIASIYDFICKDEERHCVFACLIFKLLLQKPSENDVKAIVMDAVVTEQEFVTEDLPVSMIGMNSDLVKLYIQYVADRLLEAFGFSKVYLSENPFDFITVDYKISTLQ